MVNPVIDLAELLTISVGRSRKETDWKQTHVTWDQLVERMREPVVTDETVAAFRDMSKDQQAGIKDVGGFVGGELEGARSLDNVKSRCIVAFDADYASPDLWDNWQLMVGCAALVHSTHKHRPDAPRLRILAPLKRPVTPAEYEPMARRVAEWIGIENFDDTTYEINRLMFWPSRPSDGEYVFDVVDGDWLDPDAVLATYHDWHDMREWPRSSRQNEIVRRKAETQGDPLTKPGVIGAFCRAYPVTEAMEKFMPGEYTYSYTSGDEERWTYNHGTTANGVIIYDSNRFFYSYHDHDPLQGKLLNAFDLVRLYLYRDLDSEYSGAITEAPSQKAMTKLCAEDASVRAELDAAIRQDPSEVFANVNDGLARFTGDLTEQGSAVQFIDQYGHLLGYCPEYEWLYWDDQRWETEAEAAAHMLALMFADGVYSNAVAAMKLATDKESKALAQAEMKRATKLRSNSGQNNMLAQVGVILNKKDASIYNANEWDLNTPDGIIDLRTGQIRKHDPESYCTKITGCGLGTTPSGVKMWADFIQYITAGDAEFAEYLQQLIGMAAVGKVFEEGLVISYGPGGNGKSTFFGAVAKVLGEYAKTLNADTVTPTNGKPDENYIVMLRGVRLAIMGETDENAKLAIAGMKRITSQDSIAARANYHRPEEFTPSHTIIMHTNHLPRLNSLDGGTKRRIAVAPFPATLPPEEIIMDYKTKLVEEAGGAILQWIVDGAMKFYSNDCKLRKPAVVVQATEQYVNSEDTIQQFIDEKCAIGDEYFESAGKLYSEFKLWAKENGAWERNPTLFGRALDSKGFEKGKATGGRRVRKGLKLNIFAEDNEL